jgi:YD repeat-containing protein
VSRGGQSCVLIATDAAGTRAFDYDLAGRLVWEENARGYWTDYYYDDASRMTLAVNVIGGRDADPLNPVDDLVTYHEYDGSGNRTYTKDPEGRETWFGYDGDSRLTSVRRLIGGGAGHHPPATDPVDSRQLPEPCEAT